MSCSAGKLPWICATYIHWILQDISVYNGQERLSDVLEKGTGYMEGWWKIWPSAFSGIIDNSATAMSDINALDIPLQRRGLMTLISASLFHLIFWGDEKLRRILGKK